MLKHPLKRDDDELCSAIESVLFVAGGPVPLSALATAVNAPRQRVNRLVQRLCEHATGGIRMQVHDGSAQLVSAPENVEVIHRFLGTAKPASLSRSALETLTIVAYRQPVTRPEIEAVRGVNSDRAVHTLVSRGLIEERGRRDTMGKPSEYATTFSFLEYFGLRSLDELPALPDNGASGATPTDLGLRS